MSSLQRITTTSKDPPSSNASKAYGHGEGQHIWTIGHEHEKPLILHFCISNVCWLLAVTTARVSILLLYHDIFSSRKFQRVCCVMTWISVGVFIINIFLQVFSCLRLWKIWAFAAFADCSTSIPRALMAVAIDNTICDFITMVLPMTILAKMNMPLRRKVGVTMAFGTMAL